MRSNFLNVSFYSAESVEPLIVSPKSDSNWSSTRSIDFIWAYRGGDIQYKFKIQVFKVPASYLNHTTSTDIYWDVVDGVDRTPQEILDQAESLGYITYGTGEDWEDYLLDIGPIVTIDSSYPYDLSSFLPDDGGFLWRIQTQGYVSREWSLFATDGIIRLDAGVPSIKNISAETIYIDKTQARDVNHPSVSVVSDLSSPFMYYNDGSEVHKGIDVDRSRSGLFVYYDYKDNAIVLRGRGHDDADGSERYYGTITFHSNNDLDAAHPYFYIEEVVKSIRTYTVDRNYEGYGPYEKTTNSELEIDISRSEIKIIPNGRGKTIIDGVEQKGTEIPSSFPSFLWAKKTIYSDTYDVAAGTVSWTSPDRTWANIMPINSYKVSDQKVYKIGGTAYTFADATNGYNVEFRYPPPYQDVFFVFNAGLNKMLCFGQYENWHDAITKIEYPAISSPSHTSDYEYSVINGFNVELNRSLLTDIPNEIFINRTGETGINDDAVLNNPHGTIKTRMDEKAFEDDARELITLPRSYMMSFNVAIKQPTVGEASKDYAIKIFLDPNVVKVPENNYEYPRTGGLPSGTELAAVEFHMYPDADCSLCTNAKYKTPILVDDVHIGRGASTPRDITSFDEDQFPTSVGGLTLYDSGNPLWTIGEVADPDIGDPTKIKGQGFYRVIYKGYAGMISEGDTFTIATSGGAVEGYWDGSFTVATPVGRYEPAVKRRTTEDGTDDDLYSFLFDPGSEYNTHVNKQIVDTESELDNADDMDEEFIITINGGGAVGDVSSRKVFDNIKLATPDGFISDAVIHKVAHVTNFATDESDFAGGDVVFSNRYAKSSEGLLLDLIGEKITGETVDNVRFTIGELWIDNGGSLTGTGIYYIMYRGLLDMVSVDDSIVITSETGIWDGTFTVNQVDFIHPTDQYPNNEDEGLCFLVFDQTGTYTKATLSHPNMMETVASISDLDNLPVDQWVKININGGGKSVGQERYDAKVFNGSFKLSIPGKYDYIPYYHPNATSYTEDGESSNTVPNVFDVQDRDPSSNIPGWDSVFIKTQKYSATDSGLVRSDFLLNNDFIKIISSRENGQNSPFYTNMLRWDELTNPLGVLKNHNIILRVFNTLGYYAYGFLGHYMLLDGYDIDGTELNKKDNGLYAIGDITKETTLNTQTDLCELYIKEFSNQLMKRSVQFEVKTGDNVDTDITDALDLYPDGAYTFGGSTSILTYDLSSTLTDHSPSWLYNNIKDTLYEAALITDDSSRNGHFGAEGIRADNWMESTGINNPFGSNYLIKETSSSVYDYEQITRVLSDIPSTGGALFMRGIQDKLTLIEGDIGTISGDTFSIGNVFGTVYPNSENQFVRFFFDIDETVSGISQYRYFYQSITMESVDSDYIGNELDPLFARSQIVMQTLNDKAVDYDSIASSDAYDGTTIESHRSPDVVTEYYLQNSTNHNAWKDFTVTKDELLDTNETGHAVRRMYCDVAIHSLGYGMLHFQVKDKAGNISNIQQVAINTLENNYSPTTYAIKGATIAVDDGEFPINFDSITDASLNEYQFGRSVPRSDMDSTRSIVIKDLFSDTGSSYIQYPDTDNLLIGFSDNYGISYNRFYPFNSVNIWDYSRPIPIQTKSVYKWDRLVQPDWFFDPNDIRHYSVDTLSENSINTLPGNPGEVPITIIGLMEEGGDDWDITNKLGKSNPVAKKVYEHKEEFVGKKLILGGDLSQKFTILHIFKSSEIHSVTRIVNNPNPPPEEIQGDIDGFDGTRPGRTKVWIVVEDPDAICAMVLSRRFQDYTGNVAGAEAFKTYTGWRQHVSSLTKAQDNEAGSVGIDYTNNPNEDDVYGDKPVYFGCPISVDSEISEIVDIAMGLPPGDGGSIGEPGVDVALSTEYADWKLSYETFFIDPSQSTSVDSGISTKEGWITRIFKRYDVESNNSYDALRQHNVVGIDVFDRLVFGSSVDTICTIGEIKTANNAVFLNTGHLHYSMGGGTSGEGFAYVINEIDPSLNSTQVDSGEIMDVSDDGTCVVVSGDLNFTIQVGYTYNLVVTVTPLQSHTVSGDAFEVGWWPDVGGLLLAPNMDLLGSATFTNVSKSKELEFAVISSGAFYIHEEGHYDFKLEIDSDASSDFSIDFMGNVAGTESVSGFRYMDDSTNRPKTGDSNDYESVNVGGMVTSTDASKRYFLNKGWHIGRFRYHSLKDQDFRFARVLYRKVTWGTNDWIPFTASRNNNNKLFVGKTVKSIHCKLIDKNDNRYPLDNIISANRSEESQYLRAICGFNNLSATEPESYADRVVWTARNADEADSDLTQATDPYYHGKSLQSSKSAFGRTYGGQVFEEAYGIYESNIFDGGVDLRFWKELKWSPLTQETGTAVEFYIRTSPSEEELLLKKWNNVGTNASEVILPAFTDPTVTNNLLRFTQQFSSTSTDVVINRFIQFKMILRSRNQDVAPRINDVTIVYSKENSVNFFTTTFDLESNLLRAILTYNGEEGIQDSSGVALTEIQFGISTKEEADGTVSTNFDDYTSIPVNEAFSLSTIGVPENDKFRIGIRFISSSENVPTCDEWAMMWETEGTQQQSKDIKNGVTLS